MIKDPYIGMPIAIGGNCHNSGRDCGGSAGADISGAGRSAVVSGSDSGAGADGSYLGSLPLAMCYVPYQRWSATYSPQEALARGTAFPDLDLPFKGGMRR